MKMMFDYDEEVILESTINDILKKYNIVGYDRVKCREEIIEVICKKLDIDRNIEFMI